MLPLAYYFVFELDYGIYGLGIANFAQYAFQLIATAIYIKLKDDLKMAVFWPRADSFSKWSEYLCNSFPASLNIICKFSFIQVLLMYAGVFGVVQLNALNILFCLYIVQE